MEDCIFLGFMLQHKCDEVLCSHVESLDTPYPYHIQTWSCICLWNMHIRYIYGFSFAKSGNSSQTSDGAAAVILARRSYARQNNLPILGIFRSFAVVGVPPEVMGIGPAYAIPAALDRVGG